MKIQTAIATAILFAFFVQTPFIICFFDHTRSYPFMGAIATMFYTPAEGFMRQDRSSRGGPIYGGDAISSTPASYSFRLIFFQAVVMTPILFGMLLYIDLLIRQSAMRKRSTESLYDLDLAD
jgi:hypothetical protein